MARTRKPREAVALVSPRGTRVTVAKDKADALKAQGYTAPAARKAPAKKSTEK